MGMKMATSTLRKVKVVSYCIGVQPSSRLRLPTNTTTLRSRISMTSPQSCSNDIFWAAKRKATRGSEESRVAKENMMHLEHNQLGTPSDNHLHVRRWSYNKTETRVLPALDRKFKISLECHRGQIPSAQGEEKTKNGEFVTVQTRPRLTWAGDPQCPGNRDTNFTTWPDDERIGQFGAYPQCSNLREH